MKKVKEQEGDEKRNRNRERDREKMGEGRETDRKWERVRGYGKGENGKEESMKKRRRR